MLKSDLLNQAGQIRPGDHLVALYNQESEIADYVSSYIYSSLQRKERCIYITGDVDTSLVLEQIGGMPGNGDLSGDLQILDKSDLYSLDGKFSPDKLISMIKDIIEDTIKEDYTALSITGELSWVLDYECGDELIIEYEWKLNEYIFDKYPVSALCRYNLTKFSDRLIKNIIQLHPIILYQNRIHENPYFIPPEGFKNNTVDKHEVETWLKNIYSFTDTKSRFKTVVEKNQEEIRQLHRNMTNGMTMALISLLEMHDPYTKDHCKNVASLALRLANSLNTSEEFNTKLYYAALIHDIGKTIIPKEILNKPGKLTKEEYEYIMMHPVFGSNSLSQMEQLSDIALTIRHHHEYYDGSGYPNGLSGTDIPFMSRIITICDSYDAMINDRPYRRALTHECAINEIMNCSGTQFDPDLLVHFLSLFPQKVTM